MKFYPLQDELVKFYLEEIKELKKNERHLSVIMICGCLAEGMIWTIAQLTHPLDIPPWETKLEDGEKYVSKLLKKHFKKGRINQKQYEFFNEIRNIRNKHVHPNFGAIFETEGMSSKMGEGYLLGEPFLSAKNMEKMIVDEYQKILKKDAQKIIALLKNIICSFY
jgi:hypothetical protein